MMRDLKTQSAYASVDQQKWLAIAPKVTSFLSIVGSLYIIYDVARLPKSRRKMYHRILLGTSVSDVISSIAWFFSTWATDPDVLPIWGASGTQQTCTLQGFFAQTPLASIMYSGWLAVYYYLVIRCGWSHHHLTRSKIEWIVHPSSVLLGLSTATVAASMGLLNPLGFTCWIASQPLGCDESWLNNGKTNCIRGDNSKLYQWVFWYIPLWIVIVAVTVLMGLIIVKFYKQEQQNQVHRKRAVGAKQAKVLKSWSHSRLGDIVWQSLYYVGSFYLTWTFPTVLRITQVTDGTVWYQWDFLTALLVPSQGIWNVMIYLRPQYLKMRQRRQKQNKKRLNVTSVSSVSENDPRRSMTKLPIRESEIRESEIENETTGRQNGGGRTVSFVSPAGGADKSTIEPVTNNPRRSKAVELPELKKEESKIGMIRGFIRELCQDIKAVVMKGDAGINHSYMDDSVIASRASSDNDGAVPGDSGELDQDVAEEDDGIDVIETDDVVISTEPEAEDEEEKEEEEGKQESVISILNVSEQRREQESDHDSQSDDDDGDKQQQEQKQQTGDRM